MKSWFDFAERTINIKQINFVWERARKSLQSWFHEIMQCILPIIFGSFWHWTRKGSWTDHGFLWCTEWGYFMQNISRNLLFLEYFIYFCLLIASICSFLIWTKVVLVFYKNGCSKCWKPRKVLDFFRYYYLAENHKIDGKPSSVCQNSPGKLQLRCA